MMTMITTTATPPLLDFPSSIFVPSVTWSPVSAEAVVSDFAVDAVAGTDVGLLTIIVLLPDKNPLHVNVYNTVNVH